jgi:hypothetical protein
MERRRAEKTKRRNENLEHNSCLGTAINIVLRKQQEEENLEHVYLIYQDLWNQLIAAQSLEA